MIDFRIIYLINHGFIISGASLSHTDTAEQTPLVHAAKNGHRDTVIYLLGCQTGNDRNSLDIDDGSIELPVFWGLEI